MPRHLGKLAAAPRPHDLQLEKYDLRDGAIPYTYPSRFGHGTAFSDWLMLGNDRYGDCAWAGPAHETMLWEKLGGKYVAFNDACVLSDYASTGFDPATGANDNGSDVHQVCDYRLKTGIVDMNGNRHKIAAYVFGRAGDWDQLMRALYTFETVGIGIEFPDSADTQFANRQPWDVVPGAKVIGGHYIPGVGTRHSASEISVVTWARRQFMTRNFFETYCDEWVAFLSEEDIRGTGRDPHGIDWATLQSDFQTITA